MVFVVVVLVVVVVEVVVVVVVVVVVEVVAPRVVVVELVEVVVAGAVLVVVEEEVVLGGKEVVVEAGKVSDVGPWAQPDVKTLTTNNRTTTISAKTPKRKIFITINYTINYTITLRSRRIFSNKVENSGSCIIINLKGG